MFRFARHIAEFAPHQFSDVGSTGSRVTDAGWHELLSLHSQLDGEVAQTTTLLRLYMVQALLQRLNEVPYTTTT